MKWLQQLQRIVRRPPLVNEPLSRHTSLRVGGPVDCLVYPGDMEELQAVLRLARNQNIPFFILGHGSNLLVRDEGFRGMAVSLVAACSRFDVQNGGVKAGAAVPLPWLAKEYARRGFSGLEFAAGIPGTLGGALYMNAGAFGSNIGALVQEAVTMDRDGRRHVRPRAELAFYYRWSSFQEEEAIILEATLTFQPGSRGEIEANMESMLKKRADRHPLQPSAGSVFRNPPEGAGYLIEQTGLKGTVIGGACISPLHGNFIVNLGGATAADVLSLINMARDKVWEKFGIELVPEIRLIGGNEQNRGE